MPRPSSGDLSDPGIKPASLALAGGFFTTESLEADTCVCVTESLCCAPNTDITLLINSAAAAKSLQSCPTLCDPIDGSPQRLPRPWDSPGKNTGVGCHFLLQCMKVRSESEVAQSCLTLSNPMDCSLPGSSIHGIFQARVLEWDAIAFSIISACKMAIFLILSLLLLLSAGIFL